MEHDILYRDIDIARIRRDLEYLASFDKVTGTEGGARAASYICERLLEAGIDCQKVSFDAYLSTPVSSTVKVLGKNIEIESTPRSFSGEYESVEGELVFDPMGQELIYISEEREAFLESLRGKIVLAYTDSEYYCKSMERYGVKALILVWPSDDPIREDTIGTVWGTPTVDSSLALPLLPVVGVTSRGGKILTGLLEKGPVSVRVRTRLDTGVRKVDMPMCEIRGKSEEFALLSCHYDTWYKGALDNCAANAAALELARVFKRRQSQLKRGVRIVWWGGHSNGRYAGSTWYCDNYWRDLRRNCIAHLNADLFGGKDGEILGIKTTGMEGRDFIHRIVREVHPGVCESYNRIGRGADQSFFQADIPYHIYFRYEAAPEKRVSTAPGGSWWWHTAEDTIDKISYDILQKETRLWCGLTEQILNAERLPFDAEGIFDGICGDLRSAGASCEKEFSFEEIIREVTALRDLTKHALDTAKSEEQYNAVVRLAAGSLNRLRQMYGSRFSQDMAFDAGLYPRLCAVKGRKKEDMSPRFYLFMKTDFIRQKNRMLDELPEIREKLEKLLRT